jgi:xylulose-5-phosphate/fructose-6-phosphate phosphoketolase
MIVLRTPKGWTGPRKVGDHFLEGFWRAHQVPLTNVLKDKSQLKLLEEWMRGYEPEKHWDENGKLKPELRALAPEGNRRMSANPVANGGLIRGKLHLPDFRDYSVEVTKGGVSKMGSMANFAGFLRDVIKDNPKSFRVFGPDETQSNKLDKIYEAGKKVWMGEFFEEDDDGGNLAYEGRVMEMLSEHTVEVREATLHNLCITNDIQGWLEGYILSGRHGLLNSYEPFIHIIDSMVNQHCKWIEKCLEVEWRQKVASLNILLTATVWRQDHNGFTHQDPGFLDVVANKSPEVVRIYLPPDANCLLSTMDHCLRSANYVNVIVADKQEHLQFLTMEQAIAHCSKGVGIWEWASNDKGEEPDVVMASCGDVSTHESLAATALLREHLPELIDANEHPHGLKAHEWKSIFTDDKPCIFNFHSYPWLIHRLTWGRKGQQNMLVRGYREKGNIDTPLELAIRNGTDRFSLAIDAIDHITTLGNKGSATRQTLLNEQIKAKNYAYHEGLDPDSTENWVWPF